MILNWSSEVSSTAPAVQLTGLTFFLHRSAILLPLTADQMQIRHSITSLAISGISHFFSLEGVFFGGHCTFLTYHSNRDQSPRLRPRSNNFVYYVGSPYARKTLLLVLHVVNKHLTFCASTQQLRHKEIVKSKKQTIYHCSHWVVNHVL